MSLSNPSLSFKERHNNFAYPSGWVGFIPFNKEGYGGSESKALVTPFRKHVKDDTSKATLLDVMNLLWNG
jgi:hypothetical protein